MDAVQNMERSTSPSIHEKQVTTPVSVARVIVRAMEQLGVTHAFGIIGGAVARLVAELEYSPIHVVHCRHEGGAAFAACEAYFAQSSRSDCNRPMVVFTTTGPGITNALTGLLAARSEGAKVILLSGATSAGQRGRFACQETSFYTMPAEFFTSGKLFDYAVSIESAEELPEILLRLAKGVQQPKGFVAHLSLPISIQASLVEQPLSIPSVMVSPVTAPPETVAHCGELLQDPFVIWIGFGSRYAAEPIRLLAEETGAMVMCSPRAKGIFPENHPQFLGVTGFSGNEAILHYLRKFCPQHILVLGSTIGEPISFWNPEFVPSKSFIHVNPDPDAIGAAYPAATTVCIQSDIYIFVELLREQIQPYANSKQLQQFQPLPNKTPSTTQSKSDREQVLMHPVFLMNQIQRTVVENSNALVMAESGNSFLWAIHCLKFTKPDRFRMSISFGSMGHTVAGVVGATLAGKSKAVALVGDGSMLMNGGEVSTAVKYGIPAVWIVLNDACYNVCDKGMSSLGFDGVDLQIPQVDFAAIAQAMGAQGLRVDRDADVEAALEQALAAVEPFVIDVRIDPSIPAPIGARNENLSAQGSSIPK